MDCSSACSFLVSLSVLRLTRKLLERLVQRRPLHLLVLALAYIMILSSWLLLPASIDVLNCSDDTTLLICCRDCLLQRSKQ